MFNKIKYLAFLVTFVTVINCAAAETTSFFPDGQNEVKNIFGKDLKIEKAYFKDSEEPILPENKPHSTTPKTPQEKIIAEYGDPSADHEVKAIKDAPKPFKAMIEALKVGDKKLAFEYAVQYQKYLENLEKINRDVASVQGIAMYKTGALPEDSWVKDELIKNPDLKQFIDNEAAPENQQGQLAVDAQELIKQAQAKRSPNDLFAGSNLEKQELELADRAKAHLDLSSKSFSVPSGKLDLYFFFKSSDQKAIAQGKELQKFFVSLDDADQVNVVAMPIDAASEGQGKNFQNKTGATFIALDSSQLSQSLKINNSPTIMLVDPVSAKFYQINGVASASYLDEILKIVRGK